MQKQCKHCGIKLESLLPSRCNRCGNYYCKEHRLPEKHSCIGVKEDWNVWRKEQKKMQGISEKEIEHKIPTKIRHAEAERVPKREERPIERKHPIPKRRPKRKYGLISTIKYKLGRTRFPNWLLIIIIFMLIVAIIHQFYEVKIASVDLSVIFYILEIIVIGYFMFILLKRLDKIYVGSNIRLFGLRIFSGLVSFVGILIFVFMFLAPFFALFDTNVASVIYFGAEFRLPLTSTIFFSVLGIGLSIIGAYLFFKFQRETGKFVWFGRIR